MVSISSSHENNRGSDSAKATDASSSEDAKLTKREIKRRYREPGYISPITIRAHPSRVVEPLAVEIAEFVERQESPNFAKSLLENSAFTRAQITKRFDQFWTNSESSPEYIDPETRTYLESLRELDTKTLGHVRAEIEGQAARIIRIRALEEGVIAEGARDSGGFSEYKLRLRKPSLD